MSKLKNLTSTTSESRYTTISYPIRISFDSLRSRDTRFSMAALEAAYLEFLAGIAELEALAVVARNDNTRWRGQERQGGIIDLDIIEGDAWPIYFRFTHEEVLNLVVCLQIPDPVRSENSILEDSLTALCMLLARFAWPNRLSDLQLQFGWKPERVSRTVNTLLGIIHNGWKHLLVFDEQCLTPERLAAYTVAIARRDAPLESCIGFIDG
jgi:hypothetical protein